ncbi:response regulator [Chitinibacter fontanus]|uniref:Response regulator n=1 Tax=Chitinibacter fontanus TaxID=1737446 RepID=A0A7D5ZDJ6_9NEIS|nr:response regulator [Chitinibacter fontanus]QLI81686.1 response regulator [Chitinibacter fontanus]
MNEAVKPSILIVDDEALTRKVIAQYLQAQFEVVEAVDGADGLNKARELMPVAVIADVNMPGMNGFALCKAICDDFELSDIPVMLMSAEENTDELLKVYDVGGQGFITKPINHKLLLSRIAHMLQICRGYEQLKTQIHAATSTAFTVMSNMSEIGMVMEMLKSLNYCHTPGDLAHQVLAALQRFTLDGVVQLDTEPEPLVLNVRGEASGVERAILLQMAKMDRVVQYRSRLSINYPHVKLIVNNMPITDEALCGRLRDHLAILIEAAEARFEAINVKANLLATQNRLEIMRSIQSLTGALLEIDHQQREGKAIRSVLLSDVLMELEQSLSAFGLTDNQEENLLNIVRAGWDKISATYEDESVLQDKLTQIAQTLKMSLEQSA